MLRPLTGLAAAMLLLDPAFTAADVVKLRSGGELRGTVVESAESDATSRTEAVTVETLSGGVIAVPISDVEFVTRRPVIVEEYEIEAKSAGDTVAGQWAMAEWCREHDLDEQRTEHLLRLVELEPNHKEARKALGQTLYEGEWMTRPEMMRDRGLVQHKGHWITPQELELIEKTAAEREREQAWFTQIRKLRAWIGGSSDDLRRKGLEELRALRDPDAVPALENFFRNDNDPAVRSLYVAILAEMPGAKAVEPLVTQSLHDVDAQVRLSALAAIDETRYDAALPYYLQGLRNGLNDVVRRAGHGLEKVADERAVPDLIKSLITTHRYRVRVPDNTPGMAFSTDGAFGPGGVPLPPEIEAALRTGGLPYGVSVVDPLKPVRTRVITVSVNHENPEVLAALRKVTGETFGFDERTWRLWWAAKKNGAG